MNNTCYDSAAHYQQILSRLRNAKTVFKQVPLALYFVYTDVSDPPNSSQYYDNCINEILTLKEEQNLETEKNNDEYDMVFIYDIEELTMMSFNCFVEFGATRSNNPAILCQMIERIVNKCFDDTDESKNENFVNINDVNGSKYDALRQFYNNHSYRFEKNGPLISHELIELCGMIDQKVQILNMAERLQWCHDDRWESANRCLELVKRKSAESHKNYANVALCDEGIANGIAQITLAGHSAAISIDNLYSTAVESRETIFRRIQSRFGEKCVLVYVTATKERGSIAEKLNIPVWLIKACDAIKILYNAQNERFLC